MLKIKKYVFSLLGKYLGQRFIKNNDIGLILIYDVQGTIAGVQMGVSLAREIDHLLFLD